MAGMQEKVDTKKQKNNDSADAAKNVHMATKVNPL